MLTVSESEHYLCMSCRQRFLFSELFSYVGFFVASCGITLFFLTLSADKIGFGHPGFGLYENIGFVLSAVFTILGLILIYKSKW